MPTDNFGERAATEEEIEDWVELVKAGRRASHGYRIRDPRQEEERLPREDDD